MRAKRKITENDYILAMRKASRDLEIETYGKQVSMRGGITHKSKKAYDRNREKRLWKR